MALVWAAPFESADTSPSSGSFEMNYSWCLPLGALGEEPTCLWGADKLNKREKNMFGGTEESVTTSTDMKGPSDDI